jgi:cellobiose-specific phosphotransferase system component IIB
MNSIQASEVKKICLACEAGAGSSLMVKNGLIKKSKKSRARSRNCACTSNSNTK